VTVERIGTEKKSRNDKDRERERRKRVSERVRTLQGERMEKERWRKPYKDKESVRVPGKDRLQHQNMHPAETKNQNHSVAFARETV